MCKNISLNNFLTTFKLFISKYYIPSSTQKGQSIFELVFQFL